MGLGNSAIGSTPFGVGSPATADDPPTGTTGSRYLNPVTRDYEQDPDTLQLAQMPAVRQRVLIALLTIKGSSTALPAMGLAMPRAMDQSFERRVRNAVLSALRREAEVEKVLRIDAIDVERASPAGRALMTVHYTDLTTGLNDEVSA